MSDAIVPTSVTGVAEVIEGSRDYQLPRVGDWFWLRVKGKPEELVEDFTRPSDEKGQHQQLVVVTHLGSNYVEVTGPSIERSYTRGGSSWRVHIDKLESLLTPEPRASALIMSKVMEHKQETARLLGEVQKLTQQLGVGQQVLGAGDAQQTATETASLVRVTSDQPVKSFKEALVKAKEKTLPQLFDEIKTENALMAGWLTAELIPLRASAEGNLKPIIERIDARIFNVELYAGLVEEVAEVRKGDPAAVAEPIHLMQRRLYMDEECLADYTAGGMDFQAIGDFDKWLTKRVNFERVLPFPRCMVAFRVRRNKKEYAWEGGTLSDFIGFSKWAEEADRANLWTFLYMRNGEQLFRLSTNVDFGEALFPDEKLRHLTGALYAKQENFGEWEVITEGDYLNRKSRLSEKRAALAIKRKAYGVARAAYFKKWEMYLTQEKSIGPRDEENEWSHYSESWDSRVYRRRLAKLKEQGGSFKSVVTGKEMVGTDEAAQIEDANAAHSQGYYRERPQWPTSPTDDVEGFKLFNDDNVHYDDVQKHLSDEREQHNRLVLVLQGLLDRSPVMYPHPKWELWTEVGFNAGLVLHYDKGRALSATEKPPSFPAYQRLKNSKLKVGSVVAGAQYWWEKAERAKRDAKEKDRYDSRGHRIGERYYRKDENSGPGVIARVVRVRQGKAVFEWKRERESWGYTSRYSTRREVKSRYFTGRFTVEVEKLFCLDGYQPGEYHLFFDDPRTREDYLQWAPYLLAAEDFVHGKRPVQEPWLGDEE